MAADYVVRPAVRADLAWLHGIERASSVLFPEGRLPDPDEVVPMPDLEAACDRGLLLVAVCGDEVIGFAMGTEHGACLHLAQIAVRPDHGRRGVGTRLVRAVIDLAAARGRSAVTLTTFRDIPWNAPFYAKAGFRMLDEPELSPMLRATLAREQSAGLADRVAMCCTLPPPNPPTP